MAALGFQIFPEWEILLLPNSKGFHQNEDFDYHDQENVRNNHWNRDGENREVFMGVLTVSETVALPAGRVPTSFPVSSSSSSTS